MRETTGERGFEDTLIPLAVMSVDLTVARAGADPRGHPVGGADGGDRARGHVPARTSATATAWWTGWRSSRCPPAP